MAAVGIILVVNGGKWRSNMFLKLRIVFGYWVEGEKIKKLEIFS
jgi:hypothetical protein